MVFKVQDEVLKCLNSSNPPCIIQRYSVYYHTKLKKPENIQFWKAGIIFCTCHVHKRYSFSKPLPIQPCTLFFILSYHYLFYKYLFKPSFWILKIVILYLFFMFAHIASHVCFSCFQSIFSQLKLSPNLKKVLFATALGSVALALTAHQLKRRGRKRKQATQGKEGQKTVDIPDALLKSGRPSSLKRGVYVLTWNILNYDFTAWFVACLCICLHLLLCAGQFTGRQMMSPSTRSNDTMSGISSLAPSKHSSSSHSLASVSVTIVQLFL